MGLTSQINSVLFSLFLGQDKKYANSHISKRKGRSGSLPKNRISGYLLYPKTYQKIHTEAVWEP